MCCTIKHSIIENKNKCNPLFIESSPSFAVTFKHFAGSTWTIALTADCVTILLHLKTLFIIELEDVKTGRIRRDWYAGGSVFRGILQTSIWKDWGEIKSDVRKSDPAVKIWTRTIQI
jgi:hypothetical protein